MCVDQIAPKQKDGRNKGISGTEEVMEMAR